MKHIHHKIKSTIGAVVLSFLFITQGIVAQASTSMIVAENTGKEVINSKMDIELQEHMEQLSDEDLVTVWIFLNSVSDDTLHRAMLKETGMDPEIYENELKFNEVVRPAIVQKIEAELGYERAHKDVIISSKALKELQESEVEITSKNIMQIQSTYGIKDNSGVNMIKNYRIEGKEDVVRMIEEDKQINLNSPVELAIEE